MSSSRHASPTSALSLFETSGLGDMFLVGRDHDSSRSCLSKPYSRATTFHLSNNCNKRESRTRATIVRSTLEQPMLIFPRPHSRTVGTKNTGRLRPIVPSNAIVMFEV
jgi:hypothetical protein